MDIPMIGGLILCPLCRQPVTVLTSSTPQPLRTAYCANVRCRNYQRPQEKSLYISVTQPSPLGPGAPLT